ncbi:pro-pol polyprotein [Plakobranchus ocellatus]|uniref:Pro-pol polyprotein n=1 Tax=Plakobranchus ocellatus TaxID=259542 RepID=A0AAV4CPR1_9GAST|nr:pro-pol polyprotein [Plakobranchus ocellatus]
MSASTVVRCFCQLFSLFGMPQYIHSDRGSNFMSSELKDFLHSKGIATSHTTPYNPRGNGQVERLNGTLWKTITLALKSRGLRIDEWELVLLDSLHSLRSLLSTATNETPHERIFRYNRKSTTGTSLPSWLTTPGTVLMRRNVRPSKFDPFVDEVELLDCNPQYARVRTQDGKEQTVALRHLAPAGNEVAHHHNPDTVSRDTGSYENCQPSCVDMQTHSPHPTIQDGTQDSDLPADTSRDTCPGSIVPEESEENVSQRPEPNVKLTPFIRTRAYNLRNREA